MKISIVTATWNSAATVRDTVESVLAQDYADWEHIIVDGESTDNTLSIIREYEPQYNGRLRIITGKDSGLYDAMNKGIHSASGDIIGLLNSDDFYSSSNVLSSIVSEIRDVDAVYGDVHYVDPSNLNKSVRYYSSANFKRWKMRLGFMPAHPSFYCRKRIYTLYGKFDLNFKIAADFEQLLRLIYIERIKTRYVNKDFVTMRTGGASSSGFKSHKQIFKDHLKAYRKNGVKSNIFLESLRYPIKIMELIRAKF